MQLFSIGNQKYIIVFWDMFEVEKILETCWKARELDDILIREHVWSIIIILMFLRSSIEYEKIVKYSP